MEGRGRVWIRSKSGERGGESLRGMGQGCKVGGCVGDRAVSGLALGEAG